ncbi:MAG: hypothetical protein ACXWZP_07680 [Gaiellaceae bacterium]
MAALVQREATLTTRRVKAAVCRDGKEIVQGLRTGAFAEHVVVVDHSQAVR